MLLVLAGIAAVLAYEHCGIACGLSPMVVAGALLYLFRDPSRTIPSAPLGIVSPVDGRIVSIAEEHDPFLGRPAVKVGIRMKPLDPWILRGAIEGRVMEQWYVTKGVKARSIAAEDNTFLSKHGASGRPYFAMWIQTDEADDVVIAVRGAWLPRRLHCSVHTGERVGQGQRCGMVPFGAMADVYVPANSRIDAAPEGTVRAGSDIIATLIHNEKPAAASGNGQ